MTIAKATAPSSPSRVLPGLMRGASLCVPKRQPTAYAPVSLTTVRMRKVRTRHDPSSAVSIRATKVARKGT